VTSDEAVIAVIDALNSGGINYMIVGSYSTNFYGVPRATHDADIVIELTNQSMSALRDRLGPDFIFDPQMAFETITATSKFVVKMISPPFKVELFLLSNDPHDLERFARRKKVRLCNRDVYMASLEDTIIMKLRWGRGGGRRKDLDDIVKVLGVQAKDIDYAYLRGWCDRHGTRKLLEELLREVSNTKDAPPAN